MKKTKLPLFLAALALISSLTVEAGQNLLSLQKKKGNEILKSKKLTEAPEHPFNVKMNIMALGFRNISLFGEYAFHKNMSGQLGLRFMIPYAPARLQDAAAFAQDISLGGWALTPEFRFYPGKKEDHQAPHGFYIGLYGRYAAFNLKATTDLSEYGTVPAGEDPIVDQKISLNQIGGGLMIGTQWSINRFTIDWFILGGGFAKTKLEYSISNSLLKDPMIGNGLDDAIGGSDLSSYVKTDYNQSAGKFTASVSTMMPSIRSFIFGGLCFGYRF